MGRPGGSYAPAITKRAVCKFVDLCMQVIQRISQKPIQEGSSMAKKLPLAAKVHMRTLRTHFCWGASLHM